MSDPVMFYQAKIERLEKKLKHLTEDLESARMDSTRLDKMQEALTIIPCANNWNTLCIDFYNFPHDEEVNVNGFSVHRGLMNGCSNSLRNAIDQFLDEEGLL